MARKEWVATRQLPGGTAVVYFEGHGSLGQRRWSGDPALAKRYATKRAAAVVGQPAPAP